MTKNQEITQQKLPTTVLTILITSGIIGLISITFSLVWILTDWISEELFLKIQKCIPNDNLTISIGIVLVIVTVLFIKNQIRKKNLD